MKISHLFIESHNTKTKVTTQNVPWSFPTLYDAMGCSTSGLPVLHQLLKFAQTHVHKSVMTFNHLVLCHPLLLLPSIFPKLRDFSKELALHIPCGLAGKKNLPAMQKTLVRSLGWEDTLGKGKATHTVLWPGEFHGLYSPWGLKESDTTEQFALSLSALHIRWPKYWSLSFSISPSNSGLIS